MYMYVNVGLSRSRCMGVCVDAGRSRCKHCYKFSRTVNCVLCGSDPNSQIYSPPNHQTIEGTACKDCQPLN